MPLCVHWPRKIILHQTAGVLRRNLVSYLFYFRLQLSDSMLFILFRVSAERPEEVNRCPQTQP